MSWFISLSSTSRILGILFSSACTCALDGDSGRSIGRLPPFLPALSNCNRKADGEGRALAGLARDRDVAAQHAAEVSGDRQPQPSPAIGPGRGGVRLAKGREAAPDLLRRHSDAGIRGG